MAYLDETEEERRRREEARRLGIAFDPDRDTSYEPSEDESRWLDREEVREDDERSGLPGPEEREVLDDDGVYEEEPAPDESERYLPGARKGGGSSKGATPEEVVADYFRGLDEPVGLAETPAMEPYVPDVARGERMLDAEEEVSRYMAPPEPDMTFTLEEVDAANADPVAAMEREMGTIGDILDRNPGTEDMDMREWQNTPNDYDAAAWENPIPEDPSAPSSAAFPDYRPDTWTMPEAAGVDQDFTLVAPEDLAMAESIAEPSPPDWSHLEPDADEAGGPPDGDPDDMLARADAFHGDTDMRTMEDFGDAYSTGSEMLPMEVSPEAMAVMGEPTASDLLDPFAHTEPDADEMGGPPDMDADEGASALGDPRGPMEERSAELPTAKSTPYDAPPPSGPDYTGADWSDAIRRPLHALGAGLLAASGRGSASPFRSERAAMEAREGARTEAKGAATEAYRSREADAAESAARLASEESIAADREDTRRRSDDIRALLGMERADIERARAEDYGREVESRSAARAADTARETARATVDSPESVRARERLAALAANLPERGDLRARFAESTAGSDDWTAEEVDRFLGREAPAWLRPYLGRGPDGGGGMGAPSANLAAELARLGVAQSTIDAMTERQRRDLLDEMTGAVSSATAASVAGGDMTLVPGVPMSSVRTGISPSERTNYHDTFTTLRAATGSLDNLEAIAERAGASAVIDPGVWREIEPDLSRLASLVGRIRNIGVIQPSEMPGVRGALPDPTSVMGMGLGTYLDALRGWRRAVDEEAAARIWAVTDGNEEAVREALARIHSSGGRTVPGEGPGVPEVSTATGSYRDPETGDVYDDLTPEEVEEARADGLMLEAL